MLQGLVLAQATDYCADFVPGSTAPSSNVLRTSNLHELALQSVGYVYSPILFSEEFPNFPQLSRQSCFEPIIAQYVLLCSHRDPVCYFNYRAERKRHRKAGKDS